MVTKLSFNHGKNKRAPPKAKCGDNFMTPNSSGRLAMGSTRTPGGLAADLAHTWRLPTVRSAGT